MLDLGGSFVMRVEGLVIEETVAEEGGLVME